MNKVDVTRQSIVTQTVLGGLTVLLPVANFYSIYVPKIIKFGCQ